MSNKKIGFIAILGIALSFSVGTITGNAISTSGEAGSVSDPLITQSYLEKRLSELSLGVSTSDVMTTTEESVSVSDDYSEEIKSYIDIIVNLNNEIEEIKEDIANQQEVDLSYKKITLSKNKSLTLSQGTKVVVFSGSIKANLFSDKIINVTTGKLISKNSNLKKYNEYLVNEEVEITATKKSIIFVSGNYK